MICNLFVFVCEMMGDHMVLEYSRMGLVIALYVVVMVSLCLPHFVDVSALSMFIVLRAFVAVCLMCSE